MSREPPPPQPSRGQEASDALKAVLEDQVERKERQDGVRSQPKRPSRAPAVAALVLTLLSVWLWVSPPAFLQPPSFPPPPPIVQESGLRMDVYVVAVRILNFQARTGRLPTTVEEAVPDTIRADRFEYAADGPGRFRLTAVRGEQVVVYVSDQPLTELVGNAQIVLEGGAP